VPSTGRSRVSDPLEHDGGSATLELALVLPLALFVALALIQLGLLAKDSLAVAKRLGRAPVRPSSHGTKGE
jgi:hypothetical protein